MVVKTCLLCECVFVYLFVIAGKSGIARSTAPDLDVKQSVSKTSAACESSVPGDSTEEASIKDPERAPEQEPERDQEPPSDRAKGSEDQENMETEEESQKGQKIDEKR